MTAPIPKDSIARAMREAAWVAKNGNSQERAGRFIAPAATKSAPPPHDTKR